MYATYNERNGSLVTNRGDLLKDRSIRKTRGDDEGVPLEELHDILIHRERKTLTICRYSMDRPPARPPQKPEFDEQRRGGIA